MQMFQITVRQAIGGLGIDSGLCGNAAIWEVGTEKLSHLVLCGPSETSIQLQMVYILDIDPANVL